tara:strand:- start:2449 stop:2703 length:255 start_codon:yes stop_codon:yes gene_type:complete
MNNEATIPQGKTAFTKKDMPNKKDMAKLQKLRKMLDKEKKPRKEGVDEDAPVNATGDGVDMTPGKKALATKKPMKRFKSFINKD